MNAIIRKGVNFATKQEAIIFAKNKIDVKIKEGWPSGSFCVSYTIQEVA